MTDVHTVNVTVYGARGAVPQHRRVTVLAASDDDAMAKVFRICTNNVPYINLDSELADVELVKPISPAPATAAPSPHHKPAYRRAEHVSKLMTLRLFTGKDTIEIEDYSGELEVDEYSITDEQDEGREATRPQYS